jgi:nucleoid DNA-binding protein
MEKINIRGIAREMTEVNGYNISVNLEMIKLFLEIVKEKLKEGKVVGLYRFGSIRLKQRPPRKVYVPKNKTYATSAPKKSLRIRISRNFDK